MADRIRDFDRAGEGVARRLQRPPLAKRIEEGLYCSVDAIECFCDREVSLGDMIHVVRRLARRIMYPRRPTRGRID